MRGNKRLLLNAESFAFEEEEVLFLIAILGCSDSPTVEQNTVLDLLSICLDGQDLEVTFDTCLSSSCDTLLTASCEVSSSDDGWLVTGEAEIESLVNQTCTTDCGFVTATCPMPVITDNADLLDYGTAEVTYGDFQSCP